MRWNTVRWPLVEYRIPAKGVNHSIQQSLMEESLRRKRRRRERRCASIGLEHRCLHNSAGAECSQTLHSYNRLSTKSVLNNEKVNYIRSNPVTNSKSFVGNTLGTKDVVRPRDRTQVLTQPCLVRMWWNTVQWPLVECRIICGKHKWFDPAIADGGDPA